MSNPIEIDKRIIQQAGAFIIFGLENIDGTQKKFNDYKDEGIVELREKKHELEEKIIYEKDSRKINKLNVEIAKLGREIPFKKERNFSKLLENVIQADASSTIKNLGLRYSQEAWIKPHLREGTARIQIRSKYKKAILGGVKYAGY